MRSIFVLDALYLILIQDSAPKPHSKGTTLSWPFLPSWLGWLVWSWLVWGRKDCVRLPRRKCLGLSHELKYWWLQVWMQYRRENNDCTLFGVLPSHQSHNRTCDGQYEWCLNPQKLTIFELPIPLNSLLVLEILLLSQLKSKFIVMSTKRGNCTLHI